MSFFLVVVIIIAVVIISFHFNHQKHLIQIKFSYKKTLKKSNNQITNNSKINDKDITNYKIQVLNEKNQQLLQYQFKNKIDNWYYQIEHYRNRVQQLNNTNITNATIQNFKIEFESWQQKLNDNLREFAL